MSVIYPQISEPGGFGMGLCAGRYTRGSSSYTHLFLYLPTLTKSSPPLPPFITATRLHGRIALPAPPSVFVRP